MKPDGTRRQRRPKGCRWIPVDNRICQADAGSISRERVVNIRVASAVPPVTGSARVVHRTGEVESMSDLVQDNTYKIVLATWRIPVRAEIP